MGLHNLLTQALRTSSAAMGLDVEEHASVTTLAQSPSSTFFMTCTFFTDMDLDTADQNDWSCQTDSHIVAAYRARPKVAPAVRRARG